MLYIYLITIFSSTFALHLSPPFDIRIDHYKVESINDLVINTPRPGFSWKIPNSIERNIQQVAYQIQIESNDNNWDSGRILSKQSIHVTYINLKSATYYRFRVRIWTTVMNQSSLWTNWIRFRTSIFNLHEYITKKSR